MIINPPPEQSAGNCNHQYCKSVIPSSGSNFYLSCYFTCSTALLSLTIIDRNLIYSLSTTIIISEYALPFPSGDRLPWYIEFQRLALKYPAFLCTFNFSANASHPLSIQLYRTTLLVIRIHTADPSYPEQESVGWVFHPALSQTSARSGNYSASCQNLFSTFTEPSSTPPPFLSAFFIHGLSSWLISPFGVDPITLIFARFPRSPCP